VPCPLVLVVMQRYSDIDANAATRPTRWRFFGVRDEVGAYVLLGLLHAVLAVAATDANSVRPCAVELRRQACKTQGSKTGLDLGDTFGKFKI